MKTFIASDIHFGHRNIIKYCPKRARQVWGLEDEIPDSEIHYMNERIISNWNSIVSPEDETYILGDVCMGIVENTSKCIDRLNGKKYLIRGNHDRTLTRVKDGVSYADGRFEFVKDYHEMSVKVDGVKHMLIMSHFPISHWNGMNQGTIMLHGHLHGSPSGLTGRIFDVGIDTNDLKPYLLEKVVRQMVKIDIIREHHE